MKSLAKTFERVIERTAGVCPNCGGQLVKHPNLNRKPICPTCGMKEIVNEEEKLVEERIKRSYRTKAINYFKAYSVGNLDEVPQQTLDSFKVIDSDTKEAKVQAEQVIEAVKADEPVTALFNGRTGVGKTHLAAAIANAAISELSEPKVIFVNYADYLQTLKDSFDGFYDDKRRMRELRDELKRADVVILDDVGSEIGAYDLALGAQGQNHATDFNVRNLTEILEARTRKTTVITTNLTGKQMQNYYGSRIISRLKNNNIFYTFKTTKDKRGMDL